MAGSRASELPAVSSAEGPELHTFAKVFREWLQSRHNDLAELLDPGSNFDVRVAKARELRGVLWTHDWGRYGWPAEMGGLGGTVLHRSVVIEELYKAGWTGPTVFEHTEIIAPTLAEYARPEFAATVVPEFLSGAGVWAQGFSEPEAGSDLASLRTRAEVDGDDLIVNGAKIWTTWAKYADWCLALVRTGTAEQRHRGLTAIAIDLRSPGIRVSPIKQGNGVEELAEVSFTDVRVPAHQLVGEIGAGWRVAMYLLARERGVTSWLRHCIARQHLADAAARTPAAFDRQLGDLVLSTAGVRAVSATLLAKAAAGEELGPVAAYAKLLWTRTEQAMFNFLREVDGEQIALPSPDPRDELLYQDYLFSRIVTIYGGSQQMQLMTVARHILGLGSG